MITALGLGTKGAPANTNLDPQSQFWSWLSAFKNPDELGDSGHHERAYFSGFACTQTNPAGMSIQIGGGDEVDSAAIFIDSNRAVLLSTDGTPQKVTIPTAPASGSRIDAVVSYIDTTSADAEAETPGTPEYVKTIVVSGTASGSPSAPTDSQIVSALPAGANAKYYRWCDVRVAQGATTITNSNITDRKPDAPNVYYTPSPVWGEQSTVVASGGSWGSVNWAKRRCGNATVYFMNKYHQISLNANSWQAYNGAYKLPDSINIATDAINIWFQATAKIDDAACKIDVYVQGDNINAVAGNQFTSTVSSNARIACQLWVFDD